MKQSLLKCAAVVAGVILGSNGSLAADNVWTYYAAGADGNPTGGGSTNCIVQGNWIIAATYDASQPAKLTIGLPIEGSGALNFWDMKIGDAAITDVGMSSLAYDSGCATGITEFRMNHFTGTQIPRFGGTSIADVQIEGAATEILGVAYHQNGAFESCTKLEACEIDCPITTVGAQAFDGCTALTSDVMKIIRPYTATFGTKAFANAPLTGDLVLTNVTDSSFASAGYVFSGGKFSSVKLGGLATSLTVDESNGTLCHNFSAEVKNYELEFTNLTSVTKFVLPGVTNLTICGSSENWTKGMIDVLLGNVAAVASSEEAGKPCTIYCSRKQGWKKKFASALDGKEADYAPVGCFGVYESETATSGKVITSVGRKAWLVHKAMPGDPTGMCIMVR